jgi:hypothetical protein
MDNVGCSKASEIISMSSTRWAWVSFALSSALIVCTSLPVLRIGWVYFYFPIVLLFGCDGAGGPLDCLRMQLTPLVPPILVMATLVICPISIRRGWYLASVLIAATACALSWLAIPDQR